MNPASYLTFIAILPIVLSSHLIMGKPRLQEVDLMAERHLRKAEDMAKRPLKPSLKIRNGPAKVIEVPASQSTVMECEASGNPPATIHWLKDGKRIPQSMYEITNPGVNEEETPIPLLGLSLTRSRLFVDCVGPREAGVYTCVAENMFNKTIRRSSLRVTDFSEDDPTAICLAKKSFNSPARIHMWTHNRLELIGSDVQLFCRSEGIPKPKTTWLGPKNKPVPKNSGKFEILENGDLVIRNIKWSDMGDYTCQVQNLHGFDSTRTFLYPTQPSDDIEM